MSPNLADDPVMQDPHRLSCCAAASDCVRTQHRNGVFASRDGGSVWRELTAALPSPIGFAVVAHPQDAKTAWFVPANDAGP